MESLEAWNRLRAPPVAWRERGREVLTGTEICSVVGFPIRKSTVVFKTADYCSQKTTNLCEFVLERYLHEVQSHAQCVHTVFV